MPTIGPKASSTHLNQDLSRESGAESEAGSHGLAARRARYLIFGAVSSTTAVKRWCVLTVTVAVPCVFAHHFGELDRVPKYHDHDFDHDQMNSGFLQTRGFCKLGAIWGHRGISCECETT
jgi:hypothetical protein